MLRIPSFQGFHRKGPGLPARRWWSMLACSLALVALPTLAEEPKRPVSSEFRAAMDRAVEGRFSEVPPALRASVARAERLGQRLHEASGGPGGAASPADQAWLDRAQRWHLPGCQGNETRAVMVEDTAPGDAAALERFVYLLSHRPDSTRLMVGRHFRLRVSADGTGFDEVQASAAPCLGAPDRTELRGVFLLVQLQNCTPDEFHVWLSLRYHTFMVVVTSVGVWRIDAGRVQLASSSVHACQDTRAATVLNRWVALGGNNPEAGWERLVARPYMDPRGGFAADIAGVVREDEAGRFHWISRAPADLVRKIRLSDGERLDQPLVAVLTAQALADLELESPTRAPAEPTPGETILLASYLNHGGDSASALTHLKSVTARSAQEAVRQAFELGYAYNALHRYDDAVKSLTVAEALYPPDSNVCRELAYANAMRGDWGVAVAKYTHCLSLLPDGPEYFRVEVTSKLVELTRRLGDAAACRAWADKLRFEVERFSTDDAKRRRVEMFRNPSCTR